jgi:hypothetical protein
MMGRGKPVLQCVTRTCGDRQWNATSKGLCRKCYNAAVSLIGRKLTSWEELESLGLIEENTGAKFLMGFNRATNGRLNAPKKARRK